MTETSPLATTSDYIGDFRDADEETQLDVVAMQGLPLPFVELRATGDDGEEVDWDGESTGELEVRGPWIARSYYNDPSGDDRFDDGWLRTGDVASIDERGYIRISDRSKDVIKSGGEWISSVALENALMAHPAVAEASVVGVPDEKWGERPLATVVVSEGVEVSADELRDFLAERVAHWQLPERWSFIDEVP